MLDFKIKSDLACSDNKSSDPYRIWERKGMSKQGNLNMLEINSAVT